LEVIVSAVDIVNLISSLASLILSVIAIWLALHFYDKSKDSEKQTEVNVNEIKTQTQALTDISTRMLDKYTDYATKPKEADETFLAVVQLLSQTTVASIGNYPTSNNTNELRNFAVNATILALFYAGFTNLTLQDLLPENVSMIDSDNNLPNLLDASKEDFLALDSTLGEVDVNTLNSSSLANVYQIAVGWKGGDLVKNMAELYPGLATQ